MKQGSCSRSMCRVLLGLILLRVMVGSAFGMGVASHCPDASEVVWWFGSIRSWTVAIWLGIWIAILPPFKLRKFALHLLALFMKVTKVCGIPHATLLFCAEGRNLLVQREIGRLRLGYLRCRLAANRLHLRYLLIKRWVIHLIRDLRVNFLPNVESSYA